MNKRVAILVLLCLANNLTAMTAGQKLIRMIMGDYAKVGQQKSQVPQDYDYELIIEQDIGMRHQAVQIEEKCRNGQVAGKVLTINNSTLPSINPMEPDQEFGFGASQKSYYGPMGSQELREKIASAGTCSTDDKVCSPAGMCVCTNVTTRIWRKALEKK